MNQHAKKDPKKVTRLAVEDTAGTIGSAADCPWLWLF
jgi:hypothetical protein